IDSAGVFDTLPLNGQCGPTQPFTLEGRPAPPVSEQPEVDVRVISPGYLRAMHIPILRGRDLTDSDIAGKPGAVLISDSLARRFWHNEDPLAKHLTLNNAMISSKKEEGLIVGCNPAISLATFGYRQSHR